MLSTATNASTSKNLSLPLCLAIIDLGTNSIRLDIYRVDQNFTVTRLHRFKEMIRLGDGVFKSGYLKEDVMARALQSFDGIKQYIKEFNVNKVIAFATCALRHSSNALEFVAKVKQRTGIQITIISGKEEAELIAKAILNNERTPPGHFGLIDIGGGSTEVSLCYKYSLLDCYSFDLGAIRLQQKFFESIHPNPTQAEIDSAVKKTREYIRQSVKTDMQGKQWPKIKSVIGSSGTIRAVWKIIKKSGKSVDPYKIESLSRIIKKMITMSPEEILQLPGMEEKRVDIIIPGAVLLDEFCKIFGVEDIYTTGCSLRDGILDWQMERILHS